MIGGPVARHTLGRERPVMVPNGRGGVEKDFSGASAFALPGWALDAGPTVRDDVNRDGAEIVWTARGPYTANVERHDRITALGLEYQIVGAVIRQPGPSALTSHTILLLKKWEG